MKFPWYYKKDKNDNEYLSLWYIKYRQFFALLFEWKKVEIEFKYKD